jgi:SAM-dependent methyltransferase
MKETLPLHAMNPLNRFSDRAIAYAKYRPSYPKEAIAIILEGKGNPSQLVAADIGAGTGISSRLLAQNGVRVIAIEPNLEMQATATPHPLVEFHNGTAESTNLAAASVDLVTCFQSFHWFQPEPTLQEFQRILKPKGRLAIVWNNRHQDDEFTEKYTKLVKIASNQHPAESRLESISPLLASALFTQVHCHTFNYCQPLNLEGLIGRTQSTSYIPQVGEAHQQLIADLTELYNSKCDQKGLVYLSYRTSVYLAKAQAVAII